VVVHGLTLFFSSRYLEQSGVRVHPAEALPVKNRFCALLFNHVDWLVSCHWLICFTCFMLFSSTVGSCLADCHSCILVEQICICVIHQQTQTLFLVIYRVLHTIMHVYINRDKLYLYLTSCTKTCTKKSTIFTTPTSLIFCTLTTTILFINGMDYCSFPRLKVSPVIFMPAFCLLVSLFEWLLCWWHLAVTWSFEPRDHHPDIPCCPVHLFLYTYCTHMANTFMISWWVS